MTPIKTVTNVEGLNGTQTEKNLWAAFNGECRARTKYDFFATVSEKEGYRQIAGFFNETAVNEMQHAKRFYYVLSALKNTVEHLKQSAEAENMEWTSTYKQFAGTAREEGFNDIADLFDEIAEVEGRHKERFLALLNNIETGRVFKREAEVEWKCRNCGYIHTGSQAPEICLACQHPQAHFELHIPNY